jgi:hypothetical protein
MSRSRRLLGIAFLTALIAVPVRPAAADTNPCKGTAPGPPLPAPVLLHR